jgi:hypothetical protein
VDPNDDHVVDKSHGATGTGTIHTAIFIIVSTL